MENIISQLIDDFHERKLPEQENRLIDRNMVEPTSENRNDQTAGAGLDINCACTVLAQLTPFFRNIVVATLCRPPQAVKSVALIPCPFPVMGMRLKKNK